jgi:N-acetylglucosaminyl-diphospho-decaprenol L-rhamnosyltransferase
MINENRIPIIIVSYRNPNDVAECLSALSQLTADPAFDVFVCENGGSAAFDTLISSLSEADGPCEQDAAANPPLLPMPRFVEVQYLRLRSKDARVTIAEARENFGYAGAINAWLRILLTLPTWSGVWVLNPDTKPDPRALAELVAFSAMRRRGMVGSRMVRPGEPETTASYGLQWRRGLASTKALGRNTPSAVEPDLAKLEARLMAPSGVSIYVTRRCLEYIGLMPEQYFLYFEDLDWGRQAIQSCGVGYAHRSIVVHVGGTTIGSASSRSKASEFSVFLDFRNRIQFVRQHYHSWMAWTVLVLVVRSAEYGMVGAFANMTAAFLGIKAGIANETGRPDRLFEFESGKPRLREIPRPLTNKNFGKAVKRRVKIAISLGFHLLVETNHLLHRMVGRLPAHRLVILYYHGLPANFRANFARHLDKIATRVKVVPADYHDTAAHGGRSVAITFDDAFTSVLNNAIPELRARQMPVTIFIPTGTMGRPPIWEMESEFAYQTEVVATADALRTQISDLVHFGGHSLTHPRLTRLPKTAARAEIAGCRNQLIDIFGVDVRVFAFPYGDFNAETIKLCREAGYERVFTSIPQVTDPASDAFVRGRVLVEPCDGPLEFYLKMSGAYEWMAYISPLKAWLLRFLHRHTRTRNAALSDR